eukprot:TRINITY_DN2627_c0_g1_i4.p1 TRINITY_DN2627_c0_g1~~TRINITY_DN2627_c0_g1_i4.p1  ORF type:complete len:322 (-),score=24.47 TRINITY_DN2627_c0_g1_i4:48-1013(-)
MEYSGLMQDLIKRANNLISRDKLLKEKLSPYSPIERLIAEPLYQVFAYPILLKNVIPLSSLNLDSENVTTAQKNWKKTLFKINFRSVIDHLQLLQKEISSVLSISPIRHILDTRVCWYKTDTEKVAECELVVFDKVLFIRSIGSKSVAEGYKIFFLREGFNVYLLPKKDSSTRSPCSFKNGFAVIGFSRNFVEKKESYDYAIFSCYSLRDKLVIFAILSKLSSTVSTVNKKSPQEATTEGPLTFAAKRRRKSSPRLRSRSSIKQNSTKRLSLVTTSSAIVSNNSKRTITDRGGYSDRASLAVGSSSTERRMSKKKKSTIFP